MDIHIFKSLVFSCNEQLEHQGVADLSVFRNCLMDEHIAVNRIPLEKQLNYHTLDYHPIGLLLC